MSNYLRTDGIPRWSFNIGMGQNIFAGNLNEPFSLILYAIGAKGIPYAIIYVEVLKILTGGILFFLYLRTMKISSYVSIIGALCFAFSGYMIIGTEWYNFSTFFVYIAFTLFAFEKYLMEQKWYLLPIAIMFLSTAFFMFVTFSLFFIIYIIIRYLEEYKWNFRQFLLLSLKIAALYVLGMMLNCVVMLNSILQMLESPRISGAAGYFNALKLTPVFAFGAKIHNLTAILRLYSNDLAGIGSNFRGWYNYLEAPIFYSGLISLLLIPQLFISGIKKDRIKYFIFFMIWFLIVLFPYFRHLFNLFTGDYYKVSISFIITIVLIFMAAKAFDKIIITGKINKIGLIITLIILLVLLFLPFSGILNQVIDKSLRMVIIVFLVADAAFLYFMNSGKTNVLFKFLLLASILIELGYFSYIGTNKRFVETANTLKSKTGYNDFTVDALKYIKEIDHGFYRINKNYFSGTSIHSTINDAQIQDYYGTPSYMSFNNVFYINFLSQTGIIHANNEVETRWSIGLINRPLLQTFGNVKYNLSKAGGFSYDYTILGYEAIGTFGDVTVFRNTNFLPLGFTYRKYITFSDYKKLEDIQKEITLLRAFVIDDDQVKLYQGIDRFDINKDTTSNYTLINYFSDIASLKQNTLETDKLTQNSVKGYIRLDQKKLVFFTIPYDKGWQLMVDGKSQALARINIGFMGVLLDSGNHHLELKFRPPYITVSILVTLFGLILMLLIKFAGPFRNIFVISNPDKNGKRSDEKNEVKI